MNKTIINYKHIRPDFDKAWETWITNHIINCKECIMDPTREDAALCDIAWDKFFELHQKHPRG